MHKQHWRILAIDPGTRFMGIAFLDDGKLIYHTVKVIAKGQSPPERSMAQSAKGNTTLAGGIPKTAKCRDCL